MTPPEGQENEPHCASVHTIETLVQLTGVSRREILIYCKSGLLRPASGSKEEEMSFDDEAVYIIRRIDELRSGHGINLAGIRIIFELMNEVRRLRDEMRFHRS